MGCSKSSSKREIYSNSISPHETKISNKQSNLTPKATRKRITTKKQNPKLVEGKKSKRSEQK